MENPGFPMTSHWWRAESYQAKEGFIAPRDPTKMIEYDPWEIYASWDRMKGKRDRNAHPPYLELVHAVRSPLDETKLIQWCNRYGLLGLLQFSVVQAVHPSDDAAQLVEVPPGRTVDYWLDEMLASEQQAPPHLLVFNSSGQLEVQSFADTLRPYFGEAWPSSVFPHQRSPDLLRSYREPVTKFIEAARQLTRCLNILQGTMSEPGHTGEHFAASLLPADYAQAVRTCHEDLVFVDGWRLKHRYTSLLSALYAMLRLDVGGGKLILTCKRTRCGKPFISNNPQQEYCCQKCAAAEEKARTRVRDKMVLGIMEDILDQVRRHPEAKRSSVRSAWKMQSHSIVEETVRRAREQDPEADERALRRRAHWAWEKLERLKREAEG